MRTTERMEDNLELMNILAKVNLNKVCDELLDPYVKVLAIKNGTEKYKIKSDAQLIVERGKGVFTYIFHIKIKTVNSYITYGPLEIKVEFNLTQTDNSSHPTLSYNDNDKQLIRDEISRIINGLIISS